MCIGLSVLEIRVIVDTSFLTGTCLSCYSCLFIIFFNSGIKITTGVDREFSLKKNGIPTGNEPSKKIIL